jgi:hypothetical protein
LELFKVRKNDEKVLNLKFQKVKFFEKYKFKFLTFLFSGLYVYGFEQVLVFSEKQACFSKKPFLALFWTFWQNSIENNFGKKLVNSYF